MNNDDRRWLALQAAMHEKWITQVFDLLRSAGIEPVLIKGWAAARHYPENEHRVLGDIDICVDPRQYDAAYKLLQGWQEKIPVDLHKGFRHLDELSFDDLLANSQLIDVAGTQVRILRDEDHLRVLAVHWLNDGGSHQKKLKDIHYLIENRAGELDWERCLNSVSKRRRRWTACAVLLSQKYLGTDIAGTPLENEKELPAWLIKVVEKEWRDPVKLQPLQYFFRDPKNLWRQVRKRIPPNALQAAIEMEGDFDNGNIFFYQVRDMFSRVLPSVKRSF